MDKKIWELLANFESYELVKLECQRRHNRELGSDHAREIAAAFIHARSYFGAASGAGRTVKPLLLYYGVVSLARGLTLFLNPRKREAALAQAHGLETKGWTENIGGEVPDFASIRVFVTAAGTFRDLGSATSRRSLLRRDEAATSFETSHDWIGTGASFTLGELLGRVPALHRHHIRWRKQTFCCARGCRDVRFNARYSGMLSSVSSAKEAKLTLNSITTQMPSRKMQVASIEAVLKR